MRKFASVGSIDDDKFEDLNALTLQFKKENYKAKPYQIIGIQYINRVSDLDFQIVDKHYVHEIPA